MGNIQIRQQSNPSRRTQIFTQRKSIDPFRASSNNSRLQKHLDNIPTYSPIRFAKRSPIRYYEPLTERNVNTDRIERYHKEQNNQYQVTLSPCIRNDQKLNKTNTINSKVSKFTKIKSLQTQNFPEEPQYDVNSFNFTGKIVSNSKKINEVRKAHHQMSSTLKKQAQTQRIDYTKNPYDNREIIKKVRNFNDFLNQVKRKLKQDKQQNLLRNKYQAEQAFHNISIPSKVNFDLDKNKNQQKSSQFENLKDDKNIQKTKSTRKIEIALKLENEKLELQKYRKLVERQLSKTHSIENISLCTKNSGQKILTIQYETILPHNVLSIENSKSSLRSQFIQPLIHQRKQPQNRSQFIDQRLSLSQKNKNKESNPAKIKERQTLNRLKNQYEKIQNNMFQLGKLIQKYEESLEDNEEQASQQKILIKDESLIDEFSKISSRKKSLNQLSVQKQKYSKIQRQSTKKLVSPDKKMQKIDELFSRLYSLQTEYLETDRQIRQAIENSHSQSLLEEEFRSKFSSFAPNKEQ